MDAYSRSSIHLCRSVRIWLSLPMPLASYLEMRPCNGASAPTAAAVSRVERWYSDVSMATLARNTSHLSQKGGKRRQESSYLAYCQKAKRKSQELSMYRLREMEIDDKVCEQVSMTMLSEVYPKAVIERCVRESHPWSTKARRVRASTALALVLFVMAM